MAVAKKSYTNDFGTFFVLYIFDITFLISKLASNPLLTWKLDYSGYHFKWLVKVIPRCNWSREWPELDSFCDIKILTKHRSEPIFYFRSDSHNFLHRASWGYVLKSGRPDFWISTHKTRSDLSKLTLLGIFWFFSNISLRADFLFFMRFS